MLLPGNKLRQSYKETDHSYEVFFSHQGVLAVRCVNVNLPLKILYSMSLSYLENDFGFRLRGDHDLNLEFGGRLIPRVGILSDVLIYARSVIVVVYPAKPPISGEIPSNPVVPCGPLSHGAGSSHGYRTRVDAGESHPVFMGQDYEHIPRADGLKPAPDGDALYDNVVANSLDSKSYDKIRQNFKCPKFSGQARDWKIWDKGFWRYLSIWELEYVLDPSFFDEVPLTANKKRDKKLVYYIIDDAVQNSTLAASYIKQAALGNGFEAYYMLHDGFVFAGSTTATYVVIERTK